MTVYQVLCLIGIPTICAGIATACINTLKRTIKKHGNDNDALKKGVQALLRANMIKDYNKYTELGYAPIWAKDNFSNCYRQYHSLGENGVMDKIYKEFMDLPTR